MSKFRTNITNFLKYIIGSKSKTENNKVEWPVFTPPAYTGDFRFNTEVESKEISSRFVLRANNVNLEALGH